MKKLFLTLALVLALPIGLAIGGGNELAYLRISELVALAQADATLDDYIPVWDETNGKTKKVAAGFITKQSHGWFNVCGEATTVNNNTVYYGPSNTLLASSGNGQTCDINAVGNTTESTADQTILDYGIYVTGMDCRNEADANADISFTLRAGVADMTPSVTCTIADGARTCASEVMSTRHRGANSTFAVAAASASDIADGNGFVCTIYYVRDGTAD